MTLFLCLESACISLKMARRYSYLNFLLFYSLDDSKPLRWITWTYALRLLLVKIDVDMAASSRKWWYLCGAFQFGKSWDNWHNSEFRGLVLSGIYAWQFGIEIISVIVSSAWYVYVLLTMGMCAIFFLKVMVRDLWNHVDLGEFMTSYTAVDVPVHDLQMLRLQWV